jgi:hypothetical protein
MIERGDSTLHFHKFLPTISSIFFLSILGLMFGCSGKSSKSDKNNTQNSFYQSSGFEQYILGELPAWGRFSIYGQCPVTQPVRYFQLPLISSSFNFSYAQALQLQMLFHHEYQNELQKLSIQNQNHLKIDPQREDKLFHTVLAKITAAEGPINLPAVKRLNFVWIDQALVSTSALRNLKTIMKSHEMDRGFPVIISTCLDQGQTEKWLLEQDFEERDWQILGIESFSPLNANMLDLSFFQIHLESLFPQMKEFYFYSPIEILPPIFPGKFVLRKY